MRFHGLYLLGTLLQLLLSFSLHLLGSPAVFAQALTIALVTAFNFAFHHIFTYRGDKSFPYKNLLTGGNLRMKPLNRKGGASTMILARYHHISHPVGIANMGQEVWEM